jgi:uncharacterized protein YfaA (DUF2138 family)
VRKKLWIGLAVLVLALAGSGVVFGTGWNKTLLVSAELNLDMNAPDALIRSNSLAKLPADMLRVPLLHDLLTEEFLFYYENTEGRLGLSGTLRRIAYEHDVTWSDELIKLVMDEPAEVALWRADNGKLKYYAVAMTRNRLSKLLESAAVIALKDNQLTLVGDIGVEGDTVKLFALEYAWNKKLLFASRADRVVVFSDPGMLLDGNGEISSSAGHLLTDLLSSDKAKHKRFSRDFELNDDVKDHSIVIKADFLSFSYQHFFPALKALRFDFGDASWSTAMLINVPSEQVATLYDGRTLWSSLPFHPGLCVAMPLDWSTLMGTIDSQAAQELEPLAFAATAATCWYADSRLHTPLFVAELTKVEGADKMLDTYFNYGIRPDERDAGEEGAGGKAPPVAAVVNKGGDVMWRNGRAALGRSGKLVYFSPDASLVERALAVAHKKQAAISDAWPTSKKAVVSVIDPKQLAQMVANEVEITLPYEQDAILREATDQHLLPKLEAVKKYPPLRLETRTPPKGAGWVVLDWQPF